jgi:MASE9/HD domain
VRGRPRTAMTTPSERRVLLVVVATAAVSAAALAALLSRASGVGRDEVLLAVGLACAAIAARHFPLQIAFRRRMVTDGAPLFAALLLLPPWLAAVVALIGVGVAEVLVGTGKRDLRQVTFNACQACLGIAAGAAVYAIVANASLPSSDTSVMWAALLAGMTLIVVGDALVFLVVWAQLGIRFRRMAADWAKNRSDLPYDAALLVAGFLAALAGSIHAWLLALLAVPTPVLYRAMRNQMALRLQTREAVEALADIVDERDPYTFGHCKRVAEYAAALCRQMGFSPDLTDEIVLAARVHDVGRSASGTACC